MLSSHRGPLTIGDWQLKLPWTWTCNLQLYTWTHSTQGNSRFSVISSWRLFSLHPNLDGIPATPCCGQTTALPPLKPNIISSSMFQLEVHAVKRVESLQSHVNHVGVSKKKKKEKRRRRKKSASRLMGVKCALWVQLRATGEHQPPANYSLTNDWVE